VSLQIECQTKKELIIFMISSSSKLLFADFFSSDHNCSTSNYSMLPFYEI